MTITYRFFYSDKPSPAWDIVDAANDECHRAKIELLACVNNMGASNFLASRETVSGIIFEEKKPNPAHWKVVRKHPKYGNVYMPKRSTSLGRNLHDRIAKVRLPGQETILRRLDAQQSAVGDIAGQTMIAFSAIGYKADRLTLKVPVTHNDRGEVIPFPVPAHFVEWQEWEHIRWWSSDNPEIYRQEETPRLSLGLVMAVDELHDEIKKLRMANTMLRNWVKDIQVVLLDDDIDGAKAMCDSLTKEDAEG